VNTTNLISECLQSGKRLSPEQALWLYEEAPLDWLAAQANQIKIQRFGQEVYYNRNIHFEPTNKCVYSCKFCSFYRKPKDTEAEGAWDYGIPELKALVDARPEITEVHMTGGVHPDRGVEFGQELCQNLKAWRPDLHVKAFTAVEISFFARKSGLSVEDCLRVLQASGLDSLPGGGAEIFDVEVRRRIAGGKAPAHTWLEVHETAHRLGLRSNATMLYGHVESYAHRVDHMRQLRDLQDRTGGFQAFIPLRYLNQNNALSDLPEVSVEEDLRNFAVARLFLDNISHLKAYWVMLGVPVALEALQYGVDDLDGTIDDTTKIYSMAGSEAPPALRAGDLESMIRGAGWIPVERNSLYAKVERSRSEQVSL
jgi:aminodeoxyfutalosine synthase